MAKQRILKRQGSELGVYYTPNHWLATDADLANSHARFTGFDRVGDRIPNAVESVVSLAVADHSLTALHGDIRFRYFGPAPLIKDSSVRSASTTLIMLDAGCHFMPAVSLVLRVFNVKNRGNKDITYYFESRLPGEATSVADIHFHPVEPGTFRAVFTMKL